MKKNTKLTMNRTILSVLIGGMGVNPMVMALDFAQYPAGTTGKEPAPNVIISVDDSGSMDQAVSKTDSTKKLAALKNSLIAQFGNANTTPPTSGKITDNSIRLAWQVMHNNGGASNADTLQQGNTNAMRPFQGDHRKNFSTFVSSLKANSGTPSHKMMENAHNYMKSALGENNPWADNPGTASPTYLACRRTYHIFMTDGEWNSSNKQSVGNADGTDRDLGDGSTKYVANSNQTRIYSDTFGAGNLSTLSDFAFASWATDLQSTIPNSVKPLIKKSGIETIGSFNLQEYWNPKNNPATWQHMSTYTIGFGSGATSWNVSPKWDNTTDNNYGGSGDYEKLVNGDVKWPDVIDKSSYRTAELWHMALNGRGKYYPARDAAALSKAFEEILGIIIADTSSPITGFASASSSIRISSTDLYQSLYKAAGWQGSITSDVAAQGTGVRTPNPAWQIAGKSQSTADKLDAFTDTQMADRVIYTYNGGGKQFLWGNLSTTTGGQQDLLKDGATGTAGTALAQNRLDFIRGDKSLEGDTIAKPFRTRVSRQGDIINSTIWYTARPASGYGLAGYSAFATTHKDRMPMLYVGGNDGMLHGFSAEDGKELVAYVPQGVYKNLPALTDPSYQNKHKYYVDGSPFTGDVNISTTSTPDWRTLLVGGLGAGGKGYFVLDVTQPGRKSGASGASTTPLSNFANTAAGATAVVRMDLTDGADADIGHIFGDTVTAESNRQQSTQITRMNDGRWAVVMGNGYNSTNEDPVLIIQYLDGGATPLRKIAAATGNTGNGIANGLSTPRLVDLNGDGIPDIAYAGDLKGNMWKFNLADANPANWGIAFSSANCTACTPFYTATEKANTSEAQPITSAPNVRPSTSTPGMLVAFGTGQNLEVADRTDKSPQTFYALLDNTRYKLDTAAGANKGKILVDTVAATPEAAGSGRAKLVERTFNSTAIAGEANSTGDSFWNMTTGQTAFSYTGTGAKKGWYFELPIAGERVMQMAEFLSGSNILQIKSIVPASGDQVDATQETCTPTAVPAKGYLTLMGIEQGLKPTVQLLDTDGDAIFNSAANKDKSTNRTTTSPEEISLNGPGTQFRIGSDGKRRIVKEPPKPVSTINWRQLQ